VQKIVALEAAADPDLVARHFDLNDDVAVPRAACALWSAVFIEVWMSSYTKSLKA